VKRHGSKLGLEPSGVRRKLSDLPQQRYWTRLDGLTTFWPVSPTYWVQVHRKDSNLRNALNEDLTKLTI
jgi:hypothetical protein